MSEEDIKTMKPCPFCGSEDVDPSFVMGFGEDDSEKPQIASGCMDCGAASAMVNVPDDGGNGHKQSIVMWNKRANE